MLQNILSEDALVDLERRKYALMPQTCMVVEHAVICFTIEGPATLEDLAGLDTPQELAGGATFDDLLGLRYSALGRRPGNNTAEA